MSNLIIENAMDSTLDLSAINDVNGNPVSLWPRGEKRSSREITKEAALHDAVQNVVNAKWATLTSIATAAAPNVEPTAPAEVPSNEPEAETEVAAPQPTDSEPGASIEIVVNASPDQVAAGVDQVVEKMSETSSPPAPSAAATEARGSRRGRSA